jgi:quercetin dioxygenase-like cupin family protein
MLKVVVTALLSGVSAAIVVLVVGSFPTVGATPAHAPESQQIIRNTMLESVVELAAGTYTLTIAELVFEAGAATPEHMHPGPSVGYVQDGRLVVSVTGTGGTATHSSGSVIDHPWDRPHIFRNNGSEAAKMLSFELNPIALRAE